MVTGNGGPPHCGYFENNTPGMRYHWFRRCSLSVTGGS